MYLVDTDVLSEVRKRARANPGVRRFFADARVKGAALYLSVITLGEIRRGVETIRHRGDTNQADLLEAWLAAVLRDFSDNVLDFSHNEAQEPTSFQPKSGAGTPTIPFCFSRTA